jgi:hypothetical protein
MANTGDLVRVNGPVYIDPTAEEIGYDRPDAFDAAWLDEALKGLAAFAADIPAWFEHARGNTLGVRIALGDDFVDVDVFDHDALPESANERLAEFVRRVTEANRVHRTPLWSNSECHLGGAVAARLAMRSRAYISLFIEFLETNDLDHEVEQAEQIDRVVEAHGWCPETVALWVGRLGTCAGQHGHEHEWDEVTPAPLANYIAEEPARRDLLVQLIAGNMLALLNHWDDAIERQRAELEENLEVFWDDLGDLGLGEMADDIVAEATALARGRLEEIAAAGGKPEHWLAVLPK